MFFIQPQYSIIIYYWFYLSLFTIGSILFPPVFFHFFQECQNILFLFLSPYIFLSLLIHESVKTSVIRTSIVFNFDFPNNTILPYFFFFFFIINLYLLIPAAISQIFIPTAELVIQTGRQTNEANAEIETEPVIVETEISKGS